NARLTFRNSYSLYTVRNYAATDAGTLEISINGGSFKDILEAGGSFIAGGYSAIATTDNPIAKDRQLDSSGGFRCWSGNTNGYVTTIVELPSSAAGQSVRFRWRMGAVNPPPTQTKMVGQGWRVDTISLVGCTPSPNTLRIISITPSGSNIDGTFEATQGGTYRLERTLSLSPPSWQSIAGVNDLMAASTGPAQITDTTGPINLGKAFY